MKEKCSFLEIPEFIEKTMDRHLQTNFIANPDLETIYELDKWARGLVESLASKR
jgi:1-deoxy-D-xylulose 5-phosphate reductoisomerase